MRRIIRVLAALAGVGLVVSVSPVGAGPPLPTGFTADPAGGTVATMVTVTGTWDVPCPLIDSRLSLLPPVGDDTVIADNGTGALGSNEVLLDITPDDIPTAGTYRLRMTCGGIDNAYFVDWPVTEPEPDPEAEPGDDIEAEPALEVVEAAPAFTG